MGRRDADPRPPVEIWGVDEPVLAPVRVEVGGRGARRTPLLVAAAVVALLVGGLVLGGSDDEPTSGATKEDPHARDRAELDRPSTTSTTPARPTTTSSTSTTLLLGPVFPELTGAALLVPDQSERWTWLDLDTGLRRDVQVLADDPYSAVPVRSGIVVTRHGTAWFAPLPEGAAVELGPADQILSSGLPDAVWLVRSGGDSGLPSPSGTSARLVDTAGGTRRSVAVPQLSYAFAAIPDGLVFSAAGRTYLAGVDGVRPLADGELLGAAGQIVVLLICDDEAVCAPRVLDTAAGRAHDLRPIPNPAQFGVSVLPSEDGRVAIVSFDGGPRLVTYDATGRSVASSEMLAIDFVPRWLPGGLGLVTTGPRGISRVVARPDGSLAVEPIAALEDQRGDVVLLIPG